MTKNGQTTDYTAKDHLSDLNKYIGENVVNYIMINTQTPTKEAMAWYDEYNEVQVKDDLSGISGYKIIHSNLLKNIIIEKSKVDNLKRSIIRHDSEKLASEIIKLVKSE